MSTIFSKIISGEIPGYKIYEDEFVIQKITHNMIGGPIYVTMKCLACNKSTENNVLKIMDSKNVYECENCNYNDFKVTKKKDKKNQEEEKEQQEDEKEKENDEEQKDEKNKNEEEKDEENEEQENQHDEEQQEQNDEEEEEEEELDQQQTMEKIADDSNSCKDNQELKENNSVNKTNIKKLNNSKSPELLKRIEALKTKLAGKYNVLSYFKSESITDDCVMTIECVNSNCLDLRNFQRKLCFLEKIPEYLICACDTNIKKVINKYKGEYKYARIGPTIRKKNGKKLHVQNLWMQCVNPECNHIDKLPIHGIHGWLLREGWECEKCHPEIEEPNKKKKKHKENKQDEEKSEKAEISTSQCSSSLRVTEEKEDKNHTNTESLSNSEFHLEQYLSSLPAEERLKKRELLA